MRLFRWIDLTQQGQPADDPLLTATALVPVMAGLFLPGKRNPREGIYSSLFGLGTVLLYYGSVSFLGRPEDDAAVYPAGQRCRVAYGTA